VPNSSSFSSEPSRHLRRFLAALLAATVLWVCHEIPGFDYAMLMDDDTNIAFNPHLGVVDLPRLSWMFTDVQYVARYLPLGWLSFSALVMTTGLSPAGIHVAGVVFHLFNALLMFACLRRLVWKFAPAASAREKTLAAALGAFLWALHPLRIEPVAWCSGLLYTQGNFFALAAIYGRLRLHETTSRGIAGQLAWRLFTVGMFLLSLLTYPVALFLPVLIVVLDLAWLRANGAPEKWPVRAILRWDILVLGILSGLALAMTLFARQVMLSDGIPPATLAEFGVGARGLQACYVWASYLWRSVWPMNLTPVMEALFEIRLTDPRIWAPLPLLTGITAGAWFLRRKLPFLGACWITYLVWMIPMLGLTEHPHTAADRYSYLSGALFSAVVALGILHVASRPLRLALFAGGGALVAICAVLSMGQARIWRDSFTTHAHVLEELRDEDLKKITLIRIAKLRFLQGDVAEGRDAAQKIFENAPHIAGIARTWREIAPLQPLAPEVSARPLQEWALPPLAWLHQKIANDLLAAGRLRDALQHFDRAVAWAPAAVEVRFRRSILLATLGDPQAALRDWLFLERSAREKRFGVDALRFAGGHISASWLAAGEVRLARAMQRRISAASESGLRVPSLSAR
jgi:tetratricopeptide (TPR) repeat protein